MVPDSKGRLWEAEAGLTAAYDRAAVAWRASRPGAVSAPLGARLDRLLAGLPPGAAVLDVGCGAGVPLASGLAARGCRVTGLDASAALLAIARVEVPGATFVHGDMRAADPGGPFDALVAWDSVFHVPRGDHAAVFARFHSWLRPAGRLLLSLGGSAWEGTSEMLGETFFYSGYAPPESMRLLERSGFEVLEAELDDPSSRGHLAVLALRAA